jgi:hypothetical protein
MSHLPGQVGLWGNHNSHAQDTRAGYEQRIAGRRHPIYRPKNSAPGGPAIVVSSEDVLEYARRRRPKDKPEPSDDPS